MNIPAAVLMVIVIVLPNPGHQQADPGPVTAPQAPTSYASGQAPLALIYDNPPFADDDDAKDLAAMLQQSRYKFRIQYVGSKSDPLTAEQLQHAALFGFPGGELEQETAKRDFGHEIPLVQNYVTHGGRFLGVCAGGFVIGKDGFDVFPGKVDSYVGSPGAQAKDDKDQAIQINWMGRERTVDFQDGNYVQVAPGTPGVTVLGTYNNGLIAAGVAVHGRGKAGFSGPHFESDQAGDSKVNNLDMDFQLVDALMS